MSPIIDRQESQRLVARAAGLAIVVLGLTNLVHITYALTGSAFGSLKSAFSPIARQVI